MSTNSEAARLNLEFYRKQAKALLKSAESGDAEARQRIARYSPEQDPEKFALHDAQLAIAREQGYPSWPRMKQFFETAALDDEQLAEEFLKAAFSDLRRAEEILDEHPELAQFSVYAALVTGELEYLQEQARKIPNFVNTKGGPRNFEPLLYVCFSRFANRRSSCAPDLAETAEWLIQEGANPDATYESEEWPDNPFSCLYGATGVNNNPALAQVLLEAGANPNDGESLYHSTEHPDLDCMRLLLEHGARLGNSLKHMLDYENLEGVQLLLKAGENPNETHRDGATALHWAVWRGRGPKIINALLDAGADIDAVRHDGRTAYAIAVNSGQTQIAELLAERGAKTDLAAIDQFIEACANATPKELDQLLSNAPAELKSPETGHLLADLASARRPTAVAALIRAGVPLDSRGDLGATALHWACWKGYPEIAKLLLDHGAPLNVRDRSFNGTPAGWFCHGVRNCNEPGGDYASLARILLDAAAELPPQDVPTGNAAVDEVLRERGVIQ